VAVVINPDSCGGESTIWAGQGFGDSWICNAQTWFLGYYNNCSLHATHIGFPGNYGAPVVLNGIIKNSDLKNFVSASYNTNPDNATGTWYIDNLVNQIQGEYFALISRLTGYVVDTVASGSMRFGAKNVYIQDSCIEGPHGVYAYQDPWFSIRAFNDDITIIDSRIVCPTAGAYGLGVSTYVKMLNYDDSISFPLGQGSCGARVWDFLNVTCNLDLGSYTYIGLVIQNTTKNLNYLAFEFWSPGTTSPDWQVHTVKFINCTWPEDITITITNGYIYEDENWQQQGEVIEIKNMEISLLNPLLHWDSHTGYPRLLGLRDPSTITLPEEDTEGIPVGEVTFNSALDVFTTEAQDRQAVDKYQPGDSTNKLFRDGFNGTENDSEEMFIYEFTYTPQGCP